MNQDFRPWGNYTILLTENTFQIKKLVVEEGKRLSLQSHQFRAEHWFVISGFGVAELDGQEIELNPGRSIDIPIGSKHRITCTSGKQLVFVEIQTGSSFEESDIMRYEDDFGRK
jgi:mannose-6-phosphate isomerase-like protein (cupin superfamily)